jgi:hypothetical protein
VVDPASGLTVYRIWGDRLLDGDGLTVYRIRGKHLVDAATGLRSFRIEK